MIKSIFFLIFFSSLISLQAQHTDANIFGDVKSHHEHLPFVTVYIEGTNIGTTTDVTGHYMLIDLPAGEHIIVAQMVGYETARDTINAIPGETIEVNFDLVETQISLNEVVVTGTKTFKRQTDSPVIVNVLEAKSLNSVQACNISDGLRFQPGLRVETDCQTCNYTQLRMNGLSGSYSQILINGRPIFSPLTGLYGMEQIPANMVERIEIVRGGGSALYGSSAIGGTVNIITRIPKENFYDLSFTTFSINGDAMDYVLSGNVNMLTQKRNAGAAIFVNHRQRQAYDHNGDNFSELPQLKNNSFGANLFYRPNANQKLDINVSSLHEYRYGGEMITDPAYLAQQSEERTHDVMMGSVDYQINFREDKSSFIAYMAGQYTERKHYTGIFPDSLIDIEKHLLVPPYGYTENYTVQAGMQFNQRINTFLDGKNTFTLGAEYVSDNVTDTIAAYHYILDQSTQIAGGFFQADLEVLSGFTILAGLRLDKHNLVDKVIMSPRVSLLYKYKSATQFRLTFGTGFRAPQAFDTDMHLAFAGGGVSRISLSPELSEEKSYSFSGSVNYDKIMTRFIAGFTLEGFYTKLNDAFYLQPIGSDEYGDLFEKRNGPGATVTGATLELRANYNRQAQIEGGFTLQRSAFDEPVETIQDLEPKEEFLRTPDAYGYLVITYTPGEHLNASLSGVYTGPMALAHFSPDTEIQPNTYVTSPSFTEVNVKLGYTFLFENIHSGIELYGGVRNIFNAYQDDFDSGKNRDSNYIYGPASPRTYYIGIRLKSI